MMKNRHVRSPSTYERIARKLERERKAAAQQTTDLALIEKANPAAALAISRYSPEDDGQPYDYDLASHIKVYLVNVYAYAAQRAIARDVASTPLLVQQRKTVDGELQWRTVETGDLYELLHHPNNDETFEQLCERWILSLLGAGNGFLLHDGVDRELYYLQPDWVKVNVDRAGRHTGYTINNRGLTVRQDVDQVIHVKLANPKGEYYGMPPSEVIKRTILTKINLSKHLNSFFAQGAMLGTVISTDQTLTPAIRDAMRKDIRRVNQGENMLNVAILEAGTKVDRLTHPLKDLIPVELDKMVMREVLAAYGVPPIKIGVLDEATYNNAKEQDRMYERSTCEPIRRNVQGTLNLQFVPRFGENIRVLYDRSEVPGLQPDENEKAKKVVVVYRAGLITKNEGREEIGYDPVDEEQGGDEFYTPIAGFGVGSNVGNGNNGDGNGNQGGDGSKRFTPLFLKGSEDPRVVFWNAHEKRLTKQENRFANRISGYFDAQLDRLLAKIDIITGKGAMPSRLGLYVSKDSDFDPNEMKQLFDLEAENAVLVAEMAIIMRSIVEQSGQTALDDFSIDFVFDVENMEVYNVIEAFKNRITYINNHTWDKIKGIISDAYKNGEGVDVIARRLREQVADWTNTKLENYRAKRIARTEVNGMVNGGTQQAYVQAGIEEKEWLATRDANTRDTHIYADGQKKKTTEPFEVGGSLLMNPGDPSAPASETVNCRCAMIPVIE